MRSVDEWFGKSDDTPPPARVKARIGERHGWKCVKCGLPINDSTRLPQFDHIVALCNGGENRESNFQLLCAPDHRVKTQVDVAMKSSEAKRLKKRLRLQKRRTIPYRKFDGTGVPSRWR